MLKIFNKKKQSNIIQSSHEIKFDPNAIDIVINSTKDKYANIYYKHGAYTYIIEEKKFYEYSGEYYWTQYMYPASFFDTKENAVKEIMSIIENVKR